MSVLAIDRRVRIPGPFEAAALSDRRLVHALVLLLAQVASSFLVFPTFGAGFEIKAGRDDQQRIEIEFAGETGSYHQVSTAVDIAGPWTVVAVIPDTQGNISWSDSVRMSEGKGAAFYRVSRVPRGRPLDADKDGMDDLHELKWTFLNPVDPSDAQADFDQDGLLNIGEFRLGTDPTAKDSDLDWVFDGYEVSTGTDPRNPASAPLLEFRINDNALYSSNKTIHLDFGPHVAQTVLISEHPDMSASRTYAFSRRLDCTFVDSGNGWRGLYIQYARNDGKTRSPIVSNGIYLDTAPPVVAVDAPANGYVTSVPLIDIGGTIADSTPVSVAIEGIPVDEVRAGRFVRHDQRLNPGTNVIHVVATDAAGNRSSQVLECVLDTSGDERAPGLILNLPFDQEVVGGRTNWLDQTSLGDEELLLVHANTDEPGVSALFTVVGSAGTNGPYQAVVSGTNLWGQVLLFPGTNTLIGEVADAAGNRTSLTRSIVRDPGVTFRITSPTDLSSPNASAVIVSGVASENLRGAIFSVNGVAAEVTDRGNELSFMSVGPIPLNAGLTPLVAVATLKGRSYYADPRVAAYTVLEWTQDYVHTYSGVEPTEDGYWHSDNTWIRADHWTAATATYTESREHSLLSTFLWLGGASDHTEHHDHSTTDQPRQAAVTSASFGDDDVQYIYSGYGKPGWDHDHLTLRDRLKFVRYSDSGTVQTMIMQFEDLRYLGDPSAPPSLEPTEVRFRGERGFWCNGRASFMVPIEPFREYAIDAGDFTWPAFRFRGQRTDMQGLYTASDVTSVRHVLRFSGLQVQPEPMEWLEGRHGVWRKPWAAVWCKLDLGAGLVSTQVKTAAFNPRARIAEVVEASISSQVEGVRYSAALNGGFFFWDPKDSTCDTDCLRLQGFIGTGTSPWECGNSTKDLPNLGNRWGFGFTGNGSAHLIEHDREAPDGYFPGQRIMAMPYGMNNVGLLLHDGVSYRDPTWAVEDQERPRSLMVWSKDGRDLFLVVLAYDNLLSGATWDQTVEFLQTTFRREVRQRLPLFEIGDAVMLDGGTSSQLGFRRVVGDPDRGGTIKAREAVSPFPKCVPSGVQASAVLVGR